MATSKLKEVDVLLFYIYYYYNNKPLDTPIYKVSNIILYPTDTCLVCPTRLLFLFFVLIHIALSFGAVQNTYPV